MISFGSFIIGLLKSKSVQNAGYHNRSGHLSGQCSSGSLISIRYLALPVLGHGSELVFKIRSQTQLGSGLVAIISRI